MPYEYHTAGLDFRPLVPLLADAAPLPLEKLHEYTRYGAYSGCASTAGGSVARNLRMYHISYQQGQQRVIHSKAPLVSCVTHKYDGGEP